MKTIKVNRRQFLARTSAGAASFHILPSGALSAVKACCPARASTSRALASAARAEPTSTPSPAKGHNIVALCDVDDGYAAEKFEQYPKARRFKDYRDVLDQMGAGVDAVVIGTPYHTHAVIALEAMRRGKHVYREKPLAHSVHESAPSRPPPANTKSSHNSGNQGHSELAPSVGSAYGSGPAAPSAKSTLSMPVVTHSLRLTANCVISTRSTKPTKSRRTSIIDLWIGPFRSGLTLRSGVHWNWRGWMPFGTGTVGDWFRRCNRSVILGPGTSTHPRVSTPKSEGLMIPRNRD